MVTASLALIVFDTNVIIDIWLGRDDDRALLLLELAEEKRIEVVVPRYALLEFKGTALRFLRDEKDRLDRQVRAAANGWIRSKVLGEGADMIREGSAKVETKLVYLKTKVDEVVTRIEGVARVEDHSLEIHFRGDLRYLQGLPPDRPVDGLKDCRIYEAVLEIAKRDKTMDRPKRFFVTKDRDFDYPVLTKELEDLGFVVRSDLGRLYGELLR